MVVRTVGFDIDLTLVDTRERILRSVVAGFGDVGVTTTADAVVPHLGIPLAHKVAALAPGTDVDAFVAAYRRHYHAPDAPPSPALPGARAALEAVVARGDRVVVVSAKIDAMATAAVQEAGLGDLVAAVHGGAFAAGKSVPLRAEGAWVYVGDHPADVEAARGADAVAVAVATGSTDAAGLHAAGADVVLPDLRDFPAAYDRLRARADG
ncbi:HAD family hydrolase [Agilicoccus flavus]|uniref:HAD family hydrolase n=1 Tax=Agilicoccus flavus TaxID=2775968 RepID=UPI001CF646E8|nr:HAD hydrolase-like protein [Agilicoccus flavus]